MGDFLAQIAVIVLFGYGAALLLRWFFPEAEHESIPTREGAWTVLRPKKWQRTVLAGVSFLGAVFWGFMLSLLVRDYGLGRVSTSEFFVIGAEFVLFFCGCPYLIALALRSFVRFDANKLQWSGAILRRSVNWSEVIALTTHRLLGPRVRLTSGQVRMIPVLNGLADAKVLEAEAARRGIRTTSL